MVPLEEVAVVMDWFSEIEDNEMSGSLCCGGSHVGSDSGAVDEEVIWICEQVE